jgi:hypothetical protein
MFIRNRHGGTCSCAPIRLASFRRTITSGRLEDGIGGDRPLDDRGQGVTARFLKSLMQARPSCGVIAAW